MALLAFSRVGFELDLHAFVQPDAVLQFHLFDGLGRHAGRIEVLARDHRGLFHETVCHRFAQRVVEDDVLEWLRSPRSFHKRCRRQLQPHDGLQFVDGPYTRRCAVGMAMRSGAICGSPLILAHPRTIGIARLNIVDCLLNICCTHDISPQGPLRFIRANVPRAWLV